MPGFNQNGSLHCGWNVLTTFGHGRTLASDERQDKRGGGKRLEIRRWSRTKRSVRNDRRTIGVRAVAYGGSSVPVACPIGR